MNITAIISHIDNYLEAKAELNIAPIEANVILSKAGLLTDSKFRPGLPLRNLLRAGKIPHAYQIGGKGSAWVIPHSSKSKVRLPNYASRRPAKKDETAGQSEIWSSADKFMRVKNQIEQARLVYKPDTIKYLLIAEAPPNSLDRFFYYENVFKHDDLFLGVAKALYPTLKENHVVSRRKKNGSVKIEILKKLKEDGFYLLDLSDIPVSPIKSDLVSRIPFLVEKIKTLANKYMQIILIKVNVYDIAFQSLLRSGIKNVIDRRITFPNYGGQQKFQIEFKEALKLAGFEI